MSSSASAPTASARLLFGPQPTLAVTGAGAVDIRAVGTSLAIARACGIAALGIGLAVLAGWTLDLDFLKSVIPGAATMKPPTATCFALAGAAILQLQRPDTRAARVGRGLGLLIALIATLTLLEYAFGVDLLVDRLLFFDALMAGGTPESRRMALATAVGLLGLGASLGLTDAPGTLARRAEQSLAIVAVSIGAVGVEGYFYSIEALYRFSPYGSVAIHTAVLLLLTGLGVLCLRPDRGVMAVLNSRYLGGLLARRLLPVALVAPVLIGWLRLWGQRQGYYGTEVGLALFATVNLSMFAVLIWLGARGLNRADAVSRRSEEALTAERERWKQVVLGIADEVWVCDPDGHMSLVNLPEMAWLGGRSPEERTLDPADAAIEILGPDGERRRPEDAPLLRALRGEVTRAEEMLRERATGAGRWRQFNAAPVRDPAGTVIGSVGVGRDVTREREAETAVREAHQFHRQIIDSAREGILVLDRDLRCIARNAYLEEMSGIPFAQAQGKTPWELVPELREYGVPDALERTLQGEVVTLQDLPFHYPGRSAPVWMSPTSTPLRNADGEIAGVIVILHDVTARRSAERALVESERRFDAFMQASPLVAWIKDIDGRYVYVNRAWEQVLQRPAGESLGLTVYDLVPGEIADRATREERSVLESGQPASTVEDVRLPGDPDRWWHVERFPFLSGAGEWLVGGLAQDVTERRQAESALRESDQRFRDLAESIREVFWLTDPAKQLILYISPAYETIWGRGVQELYQSPAGWLETIHQDDRERVRQAAATKQVLGTYDEEYRIVRPDGSIRWIHDKAFPVRDADGRVSRIAGVAADVTVRRQLEAQLRQTQKMESVGILAGGVAHDFNNWLTVIFGCTDTLFDTVPAEGEARGMVEDIRHAAEEAASLTRQLLAFSRQQVLDPKVLDLNLLVSGTEKMLRRLLGEDVVLTASLDPRLSRVKVDQGHMVQVLMNLAVNARDAMPTGGRLTIETFEHTADEEFIRFHPAPAPGRYVVLAMTDTGCGMPPEIRSRVFEPFFTTKGIGKGTGLGLAVVHGIIAQSGGYIDLYSEPGVGTTFKIGLPAVAEPIRGPAGGGAGADHRGTETILLVEDEDTVRRVAHTIMRRAGYTVHATGDGREALRILAREGNAIRLLVTDVIMPGMDGRQLAERVRAEQPSVKVLYTCGYTDDAVVRHGILQSEVPFLQKPYAPRDLLRKIRQVLDQ
jgi:PAS domain S-box-containing protein